MAKLRTRSALLHALTISAALTLTATSARAQSQEPGTPTAAPAAAPATRPAAKAPTGTAPAWKSHEESAPTAVAVRTTQPITVDGKLDEAVWMTATPATDFWQILPDQGQPVSEPTEFRFIYDDDALYVGAWMWDNNGEIITRMSRRDTGIPDVDLIAVHLDSYHSHRSSNRFAVTALATIKDTQAGAGERLTGGDQSWNPVWEVRTTITDKGWFAEMRIPFSQLRFSQADEQVWGLQLERKIRPQIEETVWSFTPSTEPPGQLTFGHLVGIKGIKPGKKLEVLPYVTGAAEYIEYPTRSEVAFENPFRSGKDYFGSTGMDVKYKVTSNLTLDATVNPDFGQVEVDPAVINLSAFETRYAERRPFFVEGAEIFNFGGPQIFYSRRVGRSPHGSAPSGSIYDLTPRVTTILGAGKLTGKTAAGWSLGFIDAVTGKEMSTWQNAQQVESQVEVEPLTNYFAGRARRDLRAGQSYVGALFTAVNRSLDGSGLENTVLRTAYSGGVDMSHDFAGRNWRAQASFSPSYVTGTAATLIATQRLSSRYFQRPDADYLQVDSTATSLFGYAWNASIRKQRGLWRFDLSSAALSPGYEVNDLGFNTNVDRISTNSSIGYEQGRRGSYWRSWSAQLSGNLGWNYGGDLIEASTSYSLNGQFPNFLSLSGRFNFNPAKMNQRLTRGGPLARDPAGWSASANLNTGNQRPWTSRIGVDYGRDGSGAWSSGLNWSVQSRIGDRFDVNVGPGFDMSHSTTQYLASVSDANATATFGRRYLFADIDQRTLSIDTRVNVTLSPWMTIEVYAQPFISSGNYENIKQLRTPSTDAYDVFGREAGTVTEIDGGRHVSIDPDGAGTAKAFTTDNRDFNVRSFILNSVFRWEWRPGSTLFLVWQQSRDGRVASSDPVTGQSSVGNFQLGRDTGKLFDLHGDNVLMVKLSCWLNP